VAERPTSEQSIQTNVQINSLSFCKACRFLDWGYFSTPTSLGSSNSLMGFWVDGLSATTAQLSRAASKRAHYSGDMVGVVSSSGDRHIGQGQFDSMIKFDVSTYNVDRFSARFDGNSFSGTSLGVANGDEFEIVDTANNLRFSAAGYFFGTPKLGAAPPPELAGQFSIQGSDYKAGGVFAGAMSSYSEGAEGGADR
jgi:hypothetical protein